MKFLSQTGLVELISKIKSWVTTNFFKKSDATTATTLEIDTDPTAASTNLVLSGGVKFALDKKQDKLTAGTDYVTPNQITDFITKSVDDLTNYYTKSQTYTQTEINNLVSQIPKFSISVVDALPTSDISTTTIYLVKNGETTNNLYNEYIYVDSKWELLGSQNVDLTGYATETWVENKGYLTEHQDISGKVDKVEGKDLSTNDYTDSAKAKVDAIPENPKYTDTVYDDSDLTDRVTALETGKQDKITAQNKLSYTLLSDTPTIPSTPEGIGLEEYTAAEIDTLFEAN